VKLNVLLVTFSLRNPLKDYDNFFVAVRGNSVQWLHYIEQTCIVTTAYDVHTYAQKLIPYIEITDSLLVTPIEPFNYQGILPQAAWDWLNQVSLNAPNDAQKQYLND
jgi:hypothetical protein